MENLNKDIKKETVTDLVMFSASREWAGCRRLTSAVRRDAVHDWSNGQHQSENLNLLKRIHPGKTMRGKSATG